jgi:hypothetical protein
LFRWYRFDCTGSYFVAPADRFGCPEPLDIIDVTVSEAFDQAIRERGARNRGRSQGLGSELVNGENHGGIVLPSRDRFNGGISAECIIGHQ